MPTGKTPPPDRTPAGGLWRYAKAFLESALLIRGAQKENLRTVMRYLLCHSIELALKAFLKENGYTTDQIKNIGHDLEKALAAADKLNVKSSVSLTAADRDAIAAINPIYKQKELEYIVTGVKMLPEDRYLIQCATRIVNGTEYIFRRAIGQRKMKVK